MREKIMVIGASILDVLVRPADESVFLTGSSPAQSIVMETGGDALNEASALVRLGRDVSLLTVLGQDKAGKVIREHCEETGLDLSSARLEPGMDTGINVVLVRENGERNFLTNPHGTLRALDMRHIPEKFPDDVKILCFASIFVFPRMKNGEMAELFTRAKRQGIVVCADMTKPKNGETAEDIRETLSCVDYLFPNREEAALVTGKQYPEEMAETFLECGVGTVVIKCGVEGCYVKNRRESFYMPAFSGIPCVDTTGAGDCFAAGFLCGISEGRSLRECAVLANACGSLAVQQMGAVTGIRDRKQVENRIRSGNL